MGDTNEGSSIAAQSAQADNIDGNKSGFLSRIFDAFNPSEEDEETHHNGNVVPMQPVLGLSNLRRMRVEDVSIPKTDIVAVPITSTKEELVQTFRESGLTRIPVYDNTLDSPMGLVNLKDFALKFGFDCDEDTYDLNQMLRPLIYVPPSMPLHVLLQKMQAERTHMALVIDEYGGTDGLVTIEDLIEQVVGEIEDEHDEEEAASFVSEGPGVYLVYAKTELDDFEQEIGLDLGAHEEIDDEEIDTLGGLVFMLAGHVPARGEVIKHPDGPEFEVIDADPRRIKRLRVRVNKPAEA